MIHVGTILKDPHYFRDLARKPTHLDQSDRLMACLKGQSLNCIPTKYQTRTTHLRVTSPTQSRVLTINMDFLIMRGYFRRVGGYPTPDISSENSSIIFQQADWIRGLAHVLKRGVSSR